MQALPRTFEDGCIRSELWRSSSVRRIVLTTLLVISSFGANDPRPAHADALSRATAAYSSGDYVRAVGALSAPALTTSKPEPARNVRREVVMPRLPSPKPVLPLSAGRPRA